MKICHSCKIEKDLSCFYRDRYLAGGFKGTCKACVEDKVRARKAIRAELYDVTQRTCAVCGAVKENEEFSQGMRSRRNPHCRPCVSQKNKEYGAANKERRAAASRERYYREAPEQRKERKAAAYIANRDKILAERREYHLRHGDKRRAYQKRYYRANREAVAKYMLAYVKNRYANDRLFALSMNMRGRLNHVLAGNGWVKKRSNEGIFGCTYEFLLGYLESKFLPGMSWENRAKWHIDHETPLASAKTETELLALCHHTNLQLLWAEDNLKKGAKIPAQLAG